ncbi:MAG: heavy metal-binding domain-containing protein [Rhizobiales bacterium]|nr:heavy metal-binding domain-containing protein [Hyphomicrobiales bacterium]
MIVTTTDGIAGRVTEEALGVVRGTAVWTRRVIKNSAGGIRQFQVTTLADLDRGLNEAKEAASRTLVAQAEKLGADAVVGLRLDVVEMSNGVFCVNAAGTAVKTVKLPQFVPVMPASPAPDMEADMDFDMSFLAARPAYAGSLLRH